MIQEKINRMLGIDALIARGLQENVKEETDLSREGTKRFARYSPEGDRILEEWDVDKNVPSNIVSQMRELHRQYKIRERIDIGMQSMQAKGQASVMQEQAFKSLYNDLANEDTQSLSRNVANALRKGEKNG